MSVEVFPEKSGAGGLAFNVVLAPAIAEISPRSPSPPKDRSFSQEAIEKKLKDAEERRLSIEASKLSLVTKDKERAAEVKQREQGLNDSFSKQTGKKLAEKLESAEDRKNAHLKSVQDRLQEHAKKVEDVRQSWEKYATDLKEKIDKKLETSQEFRETKFKNIQERIKEHISENKKNKEELEELCKKFGKETEEKLLQKMEVSLKNREEQLQQLLERLKDHERHVQLVQKKKLNQSLSEEGHDSADVLNVSNNGSDGHQNGVNGRH